MLEHMPEPGAVVFAHAPEESPGFPVGAAVFRETGQGARQCIDERWTQAAGGPRFESAQIQFEADDGKARVQGRANIDGTIDNAHETLLRRQCGRQLFFSLNQPTGGRQS